MDMLNNTDYNLEMVVAIYRRCIGEDPAQHRDESVYCESHRVDTSSGVAKLLEGRPATKDQFDTLRDLLVKQEKRKQERMLLSGVMPAQIVYADLNIKSRVVIWTVPAQEREIKFDSSVKLKGGKMFLPPLLFMTHGKDDLSMYALKINDKETVTNKTILYHAPLLNVHEDANVCLGDASTKTAEAADSWHEYVRAWENVIFDSRFSHGLAVEEFILKGDFKKVTADLIKRPRKFPLELLNKHSEHKTFEDLIDSL